jgi:hypothetical protein
MAQLVYLKDPNGSDEGVVIDSEDSLDSKLEEEYAPLKVVLKFRLPSDIDIMPCDRLLVAE